MWAIGIALIVGIIVGNKVSDKLDDKKDIEEFNSLQSEENNDQHLFIG